MAVWDKVADDATINKTIRSLSGNGINALVVENGKEAKKKVFEMIPKGAEVMTMSSVTIDAIGISSEVQESGGYKSVKNILYGKKQGDPVEMQKLSGGPEWTVGSVHAVTEDGKVVVASNTGSQIGAYAYGSLHVIWVVGAQKIVKNLNAAVKRIDEYVLPLESSRMQKAYGVPSNVSKVLIVNKEIKPDRINLIFVKENLGF